MSERRPIGMVGMRPVASGDDATGSDLISRGIRVATTLVTDPPTLEDCHESFCQALRWDRSGCGDHAKMERALEEKYQCEIAFDINLFEKFRDYLGTMVAMTQDDGSGSLAIIVLKGEWKIGDATYALGFSRQVTSEKLNIPPNFGCSRSSRHDHSSVLLEKKRTDSKFSVIETSATIELKTETSSCRLKRLTPDEIDDPVLDGKDGPLSQVLAYTLSDVWTCLARKGMKTGTVETPQHVPFAIIACNQMKKKKDPGEVREPDEPGEQELQGDKGSDKREDKEPPAKRKKPNSNQTRWALGNLVIPKVCGGAFQYQITSFGSFAQSTATEALAAYLSVMTEGVNFLNSLRDQEEFKPYPLSGRELKFGDRSIPLENYKSPFTNGEFGNSISQGEFWNGTSSRQDLNDLLQEGNDDDDAVFVVFDDNSAKELSAVELSGEVKLLVKVSSCPIFNTLIDPNEAFKALSTLNRVKSRMSDPAKKAFSRVLVAVWSTNIGLVTIMHDLTTHSDLRPEELLPSSQSLYGLWSHFREFVENQLIPLADYDIIHPDIRPGYDWTANIMAREDGSDMLLVDFESLIFADEYTVSSSDKMGRYFAVPTDGNAFSFVCLQCIAIAVAWSKEYKQVEEEPSKQPRAVKYWERFGSLGARTADDVRNLLTEFESQFKAKDFTSLDESRVRGVLKLQGQTPSQA